MYRMTEAEHRLADILWKKEPISSGELVRICENQLNWKKSTTYTVLKKVCSEKLFVNQDSTITSLLTENEYNRLLGEQFLNENYQGSLPNFIAAFANKKKLTSKQISEIQKIIDQYQE